MTLSLNSPSSTFLIGSLATDVGRKTISLISEAHGEISLGCNAEEEPATLRLECLDDVTAAQAGDLEAAAKLVRRYHERIAGYVYAIVLNASDIDDVTQNVFVKMCARVGTLKNPQAFEPWLYQLARRVSLDFLRRQKFKKLWCSLEEVFHHPVEEATRVTAHGVDIEDVRCVLEQLGTRDRQILVLASEGHTYHEIARLLGASRGSIKARLGRLREWVRAQLKNA